MTCILVERGYRGRGLAAVALRGALELIAQAGGGLVDGYPHDTGGSGKKNSSFLYNGTRTMYEREGFTYDRPKGQGNCVMVCEVAPSTRDQDRLDGNRLRGVKTWAVVRRHPRWLEQVCECESMGSDH